MILAVLDANVFVSAILSPKGIPAKVLTAWREEQFQLVISASSRKLLTRRSLFNPSLDGGLPLVVLFNPSRRSSSSTRSSSASITASFSALVSLLRSGR